MLMRMFSLTAIVASLLAAGCAVSKPLNADAQAPASVQLSHGYSLLYSLVSKQSNLDKALILKSPSEPTRKIIKQVAETSAAAKRQLDELAKLNPALVLNDEGLPAIETSTRAAIESATSKQLLFGGDSFELRLLLTQVEATRYGAALARQLAAADPDPARVSWLTAFAQQYEDLNRDVLARLAVRTTPAPALHREGKDGSRGTKTIMAAAGTATRR